MVKIELRNDTHTTSGADYRIIRLPMRADKNPIEIGWIEVHRPKKGDNDGKENVRHDIREPKSERF